MNATHSCPCVQLVSKPAAFVDGLTLKAPRARMHAINRLHKTRNTDHVNLLPFLSKGTVMMRSCQACGEHCDFNVLAKLIQQALDITVPVKCCNKQDTALCRRHTLPGVQWRSLCRTDCGGALHQLLKLGMALLAIASVGRPHSELSHETDPCKWRAASDNGELATNAQLGHAHCAHGRFAPCAEAAFGSQACICR